MTKVLNRFGISATFIDTSDLDEVETEYSKEYKGNILRITNQSTLKVTDIAEVSKIS